MVNPTIRGWGMYAPEKVLTNRDLEAIVDTTDEWITTATVGDSCVLMSGVVTATALCLAL